MACWRTMAVATHFMDGAMYADREKQSRCGPWRMAEGMLTPQPWPLDASPGFGAPFPLTVVADY
jgi:hypothetical protein